MRQECTLNVAQSSHLLPTIVSARKRFYTADSDLLTDVKAFDECMKMIADGQPQSKIRMFCEDVRICLAYLSFWADCRTELYFDKYFERNDYFATRFCVYAF